MKIINFRPPRIAIALTVIATALHSIPRIWERFCFSFPWVGIFIGIIGFMIMLWAWVLFKKQDVAVCPMAETVKLVTQGPYRFTRNPMYLGMILMLLGIALCIGTLPFYLSAIAFLAVINFAFCPYEENKMSKTFGIEYTNYKKDVRRWI